VNGVKRGDQLLDIVIIVFKMLILDGSENITCLKDFMKLKNQLLLSELKMARWDVLYKLSCMC
jgi:hypothetical protein